MVSVLKATQIAARHYGFDCEGFCLLINAGLDGVPPHIHWHIYGPGIQ